ncbi:MAG: hypothetical protein H6Q36_249 [Chloroflexi bacterium]|nr:hypothetical protein [Chloroflexota bacterium]
MARAKRTDRAEARRRYRAAMTEEGDAQAEVDSPTTSGRAAVAPAAVPREARAKAAPARPTRAAPAQRPGLLASLRASYSQADILGDIKALPDIAIHSKALWLPSGLILASGLLMQLVGTGGGPIVQLMASLVLVPPPMMIAFLGGILAPRGAWLVGGIVSTLAAIVYVLYVVRTIFASPTAVTVLGWTYTPTDAMQWQYISTLAVPALIQAPLWGIFVGAFAGFYRRFLRLASPPKEPQPMRRRR